MKKSTASRWGTSFSPRLALGRKYVWVNADYVAQARRGGFEGLEAVDVVQRPDFEAGRVCFFEEEVVWVREEARQVVLLGFGDRVVFERIENGPHCFPDLVQLVRFETFKGELQQALIVCWQLFDQIVARLVLSEADAPQGELVLPGLEPCHDFLQL